MPVEQSLRRVEAAMEGLTRVGQSRRAAALRSARARLHLGGNAQQVLRQVIENAPVRISDLADHVHMGMGAVSREVTALEQEGLVTRRESPDDGRVTLVHPTSEGRRAGGRLRRAADDIFQSHLADWSSRDLARLADLMERLANDLRPAERRAPASAGARGGA